MCTMWLRPVCFGGGASGAKGGPPWPLNGHRPREQGFSPLGGGWGSSGKQERATRYLNFFNTSQQGECQTPILARAFIFQRARYINFIKVFPRRHGAGVRPVGRNGWQADERTGRRTPPMLCAAPSNSMPSGAPVALGNRNRPRLREPRPPSGTPHLHSVRSWRAFGTLSAHFRHVAITPDRLQQTNCHAGFLTFLYLPRPRRQRTMAAAPP